MKNPKRRSLLSVFRKEGVVDLGRLLVENEVEILSTGGTARTLKGSGIPVVEVGDYTGFPESPGGIVKTLHPLIHGGIFPDLRDGQKVDAKYARWMVENGVKSIDLVVGNLYPFEETIAKLREDGIDLRSPEALEAAIHNTDIGGPTFLRMAAKAQGTVVIVDPEDYLPAAEAWIKGGFDLPQEMREVLDMKVFEATAAYDAAILKFRQQRLGDRFPKTIVKVFDKLRVPRYGENPHQNAAVYAERGKKAGIPGAKVLIENKELSANNYNDADGALKAARDFYALSSKTRFGVATIKHTNGCGYATGKTLEAALEHSFKGDPTSAFGGVLCVKGKFQKKDAEALKRIYYGGGAFIEMVVAEGYDPAALEFLKGIKNLRVLQLDSLEDQYPEDLEERLIEGGLIAQEKDTELYAKLETKTGRYDTKKHRGLIEFGILAVKNLKSNAIAIVREYAKGQYEQVGAGMGQPNRVNSVKLAIEQARENLARECKQKFVDDMASGRIKKYKKLPQKKVDAYVNRELKNCLLVSGAFFPKDDNIHNAYRGGVVNVAEPGGSMGDKQVLNAARGYKMNVLFTGMRHFKH